jgi:DNA uptake protein ComE-like DNA-binding protein
MQNGAMPTKIVAAILAMAIVGWPQAPAQKRAVPAPEARVDINHATIPELMKVPGMTASWAGRIVRFRPYRTKQDLLDRGVVTSQVFDRIKDYIIAHRDPQ